MVLPPLRHKPSARIRPSALPCYDGRVLRRLLIPLLTLAAIATGALGVVGYVHPTMCPFALTDRLWLYVYCGDGLVRVFLLRADRPMVVQTSWDRRALSVRDAETYDVLTEYRHGLPGQVPPYDLIWQRSFAPPRAVAAGSGDGTSARPAGAGAGLATRIGAPGGAAAPSTGGAAAGAAAASTRSTGSGAAVVAPAFAIATGGGAVHLTGLRSRIGPPVALFIAYPVFVLVRARRQAWLRRRRARCGQCLECGYDLTGAVSGVCPECGMGR